MGQRRKLPSAKRLSAEPHSWTVAGNQMVVPNSFLKWLRQSNLPGVDELTSKGKWTRDGKEKFLRQLCGKDCD